MLLMQMAILALWLVGIPLLVGGIFQTVDREPKSYIFRWISGQMLLWAGFQLICVPLIIKTFDFIYVLVLYLGYTFLLSLTAVILMLVRRPKKRSAEKTVQLVPHPTEKNPCTLLFWGIFLLLLLFQLIQTVRMTYADGDDAYYVAVTTITQDAETMYRKLPYTGGTTTVDVRHGLAPFPIWIAFLAKMSGIAGVTVSHIVVPLALITMTYGIFYLIGCRLFRTKSSGLPLFLIFTELLILFGDYSFYTAENFMLARSRQGKAALGSIIIPFLFLLLFLLFDKIQEKAGIAAGYWLLLTAVLTAACLCSTLGAMLTCLLVAVSGLCAAVCYRRLRIVIPLGLCCTPCVLFAVLYLISA